MSRIGRFVALSSLVVLAGACAPERVAAPPFVPHAASGTVSWQPLVQRDVASARAGATVEVNVRGGELLRLETPSDAPIAVGEKVHASAAGDVEEWSTVTPHDHVALVRPTLFTTAVRFPRGAVDRALVGHGYDPGYRWFELESRVLDWAEGPLPAPFPQIAPPERIDFDALGALDRALEAAVAGASDRDAATDEARSIRRVVGLRAARILRPVNGFPYFFDDTVEPEGHPRTRDDGGRTSYELTPDAPIDFVVNGPTLLHVWSRAPRSEEGEVERVRVTEAGHERAISGGTLPHVVRNTESDPERPDAEGDDAASLSSLRRATVHVPPGEHRYRVEMSGGARLWISPLRAREIVHLEDAIGGVKSESQQLGTAERACHGGSPAICAFALALGGKDTEGAAGEDRPPAWRDVLAALPAPARAVALDLARGAPRDPSLSLEVAASAGDEASLAKLSDAAARETDDVLRDSWMRAVLRGSRWTSAGTESGTPGTWTALLVDDPTNAKCASAGDTPWSELGSSDTEVATTSWQGVASVDLVANVPCDARGPVQIVVDGEPLTAAPSSGHARWHVLVHGATAHARRLDSSGGQILAVRATDGACARRWAQVPAPHAASYHPQLAYEEGTRAPGVEIWLRDGASAAPLTIEGTGGQKVTIFARKGSGASAIDDHGTRWNRAARLPLPAWAAAGVTIAGGDDVAVRAIARTARSAPETAVTVTPPKPAEPLDEARLLDLSRSILALPPAQRGPAYLQRALVLAAGGARKGALADARAAKALGAGDGDPEARVRAALRSRATPPAALAPSVRAYGVEPDFDPGAVRCKGEDSGPRGRLTHLEEQLKGAGHRAWDPSLAVRAFEIASADPSDPRAAALARRALWGSQWRLVRAVQGGASRVVRPRDTSSDGPVDGSGDLRGRIAAGDPFGPSSVTITSARPARAVLSGAPGATPHIDLACLARDPAAAAKAGAKCPLQIAVNDSNATIAEGTDGLGHAKLAALPLRGVAPKLAMTMRDAPGDWFALARIVFDREVPGSTNVAGVGWVMEPPSGTHRFLLKGNEAATLAVDGAGLVRIDARSEPGAPSHVVASVDGREQVIPLDGTPVTLAVTHGSVSVHAEGGNATVALATRVSKAAAGNEAEADAEHDEGEAVAEAPAEGEESRAQASSVLLDPNLDRASSSWRGIVDHSPRPLTPFQDDLGVVIAGTTASYGSFRADDPNDKSVDKAIEEYVGYRRRIERLSLWTIAQVNIAERPSGAPTYGASLTLYEDYDPAHLRITGTIDYGSQQIEGSQVQTINPRGFVEYSWRPSRAFFILPRLGFDGWYTNLHEVPKSTVNVDDSVFNAFRTERQTFVFLQTLFWLTPFFNDIYYVRARATYDVGNSQVSHVALRPGVLLAFGQLDINGYWETAWYQATPFVRATAGLTNSAGLTIDYNVWSGAGSFDVQPGVAGLWNDNGAYTVEAVLNFMIGYRRGLRDYSSLELDFPEQLSDGVPWRGAPMGIAK